MGLCKDCVYYTRRGTSAFDDIKNSFRLNGDAIGICMLITDSYGNYKKVEGMGSCPNFCEKPNDSGYRPSSGGSILSGCFLTSACVDYLGKPDDCEELTALRKFRDEYMKSTEEGRRLVDEYYSVAPKIVEAIDSSDRRADYYAYIYKVVVECIRLIDENNKEGALDGYRTMVRRLSNELLQR